MKRRTKKEMEMMESLVTLYLIPSGLDAHKAYNEMVKEHLITGKPIPYYIKGIKDFIKVADELKNEKQYSNKDSSNEKLDQFKELLKTMDTKDYKNKIYDKYKDKVNNDDKIILVDVYNMVHKGNIQVDQSHLNVFERLGILNEILSSQAS